MKRSVLSRLYCIGVYLILTFSPALAQSAGEHSYIFPGVTRDMDIAIGNINTQSVGISVAFYRSSGDVVSSSFVLEAGKQTRLNPTSAGIADFSGSVIITSALPLTVSASLFNGDTPFDFILPSEVSTSLFIPFAPLDSGSLAVNLYRFRQLPYNRVNTD